MNKVQKIRAEIERLYNQSLADEKRQADLGLERAADISYGKSIACKELLSFIGSMQEEPKECMYSKDNYTDEDRKVLCDGCEEECRFNKKEEYASKDLDIAIGEYCSNPDNFITYIDVAFAYRSEQKDDIPLIIKAIKFGANWQKEQLMAKAIDGEIQFGTVKVQKEDIKEAVKSLREGEKVKVIVIKED